MRLAVICLLATPVAADTFGGFSAADKPYLLNSDRICAPLVVSDGKASGAPKCDKATADLIAKLDVKSAKTSPDFEASASGRTLTVAHKGGDPAVVWDAPDPIGKVVGVYASEPKDRVAVAYTTRRVGRDVTDVVAFDLIHDAKPVTKQPDAQTPATTQAPEDPAVTKAIADAKKAPAGKALAAWKAVLALDASSSEALYRVAALQATSKSKADALDTVDALAKTGRADAIEWLIDARFDKDFATLRAEPRFRTATGLDRKASTPYERLMGFGGQWEQAGTQCESATVKLNVQRDRTFKLKLHEACNGTVMDLPFHGTWKVDGGDIVLVFPPDKTRKASDKDEAPCKFEPHGDEDSLHCAISHDLDFTVLPTRR
jgi:hypothetical protein